MSIKSWLVLVLLSLIWGTSYILIKKSLVAFSPYQVACLRLTISALAFLPILLTQWKKVNWKYWPFLLLVGLTGTALPSFLFPFAQTQVSSSIAGILNSLTPLSTLLLGVVIFKAPWGANKFFGVILGLTGAILLIVFGESNSFQANIWYGLLIVLATICYAISGNTVGYYLQDMKSLLISTVSFVMVGIPGFILLLFTDFFMVVQTHPQGMQALGYVSILALFSTVLASVIFFQLIKWTSPVFSSMVSYLVPVVALLWGVLDNEAITYYHFIGMGLIFGGVYLSRSRKPEKVNYSKKLPGEIYSERKF